jgi:hypothetical protein
MIWTLVPELVGSILRRDTDIVADICLYCPTVPPEKNNSGRTLVYKSWLTTNVAIDANNAAGIVKP